MNRSTEALAARWPLVARQVEFEACRDLLTNGSVVLAGQPGVGKTRLCRELASWACDAGWHVESVFGTRAGSDIPLAAVAPLLPDLGQVSNETLIRSTLHHLRANAGKKRLLITVDDAHLLDSASCALVHLLVASGSASVAITVTSGQPAPDPITALWKDQLARRIELQPLSRRESEALVEAVVGCPLDPSVESRIWELTLGNVLFLRELVISNVGAGALDECQGTLRWVTEPVVAPRLNDLIESRLTALCAEDRLILEALALGEPLEVDILHRLFDPARCEALERQQLVSIAEHPDNAVARLIHPIYGQVVRAAIPHTAIKRIYARLADALAEVASANGEDVLRLASWRTAAGQVDDVGLMSAAAARAWQAGQMVVCEQFALRAIEAGADRSMSILLAQSQARQGRARDSIDLLRAQLAACPIDAPDREFLLCTLAASQGWGCGDVDGAEELLLSGRTSPAEQPMRHAVLAVTELLAGRTLTCIERAESVLAVSDDVFARSYAMTVLGTAPFGSGDVALSTRVVEASGRRSIDATLMPFAHVRKVSNHTCALAAQGRVREAIEFARPFHQDALDDSDHTARVRWGFVLGYAHLLAGDLTLAAQLLSESATGAPTCEPVMGDFARPLLLVTRSLLGDETNEAIIPSRWPFAQPLESLARACCGPTFSLEHVLVASRQASDASWWFTELLAGYLALRNGHAIVVDATMRAAAVHVGGQLAPTMVDHVNAAAVGDGRALAGCGERYVDLGYRWFACDAFAQASHAHASAGRQMLANAAGARARELAVDINLGATLIDPHRPADVLTAREQEVAALVANGRSDKEVAAALHLSVRTVNAHLRSIYTKLAITNRTELGRYITGT
ncbi:MAG: LuxR C-terminal-related transcriptional regulator [Acidimicrobiia bacterium]